jgi:AcrR family transcriptional regulator
MGVRARTETDKSARREAILAVVTESLDSRPLSGVTMAEIAQRCGLAKGTLYLYYETKEELFLATLQSELSAWYDAITGEVQGRGTIDARSFAGIVVSTLAQRRALSDLLPQLRPILEQPTLPRKTADRFRETTRERMSIAARAVEAAMELTPGEGWTVMARTQALVAGLRQFLESDDGRAPEVSPANNPARTPFERELVASITAVIRGMVGAYA